MTAAASRAPTALLVDRVACVILYVAYGGAAAFMARFGGLVGFFSTCADQSASCVRLAVDAGVWICIAAPVTVLLLSTPAAVSRSIERRTAWWVPLAAAALSAGLVVLGGLLVQSGG